MQPNASKPTLPSPGQNHPSQPGHAEINYNAPAFGHDANTQGHRADYDFILQPQKPPRRAGLPSLSLGGSLMGRIVLVLGGIVLLLIVVVFLKGLLGGDKSNVTALNSVVQEQQLLVHLATGVAQQQGVSVATQTSSTTIATTMASAQGQLLSYMRLNNLQLNQKLINSQVSGTQDAQLSAAASAGTYDAAYTAATQTALNDYEKALQRAYAQTTGTKGKALLKSQFNGAELLLKQLGAPAG